jgi:hypothetical protein
MATAADLRALEAETPWLRAEFQADLAALGQSTAEAARRFAGDMRVLARLVAQVPRCPFDDRGATPWTSFRREVAVARSISDQAAAGEIRTAVRLTSCLGVTLRLLEHGRITVARARTLVDELTPYDDHLASRLDAQLAEKVAGLPAWRIAQEVRRAAAVLDPEAAAVRTAAKNADRSVQLEPLPDDQALVLVHGPAVPLTRWYDTLDGRARALRQTGDPRTLAQLRFDLASSTYPCATHAPADSTAPVAGAAVAVDPTAVTPAASEGAAVDPAGADAAATDPGAAAAAARLRPNFVDAASTDCRMSRPVQASINVPVETGLGLSNEPAWLDGYGWISAPTARLLLVDAELRRVCTRSGTGELVDLADRDVRPPPTPDGVRQALLDMVTEPIRTSDIGSRVEPDHDPSPPLREFVALRDRFCDGPTGTRVPARRCELDHDTPHPHGPTAAWNLRARSQRTHQLKHYGWTPLRTPTSTLWFSRAGQVIEAPTHTTAPPGVDDADHASLPDPDELHELDQHQLTASDHGPRPWVPADERLRTDQRIWFDDEPPF